MPLPEIHTDLSFIQEFARASEAVNDQFRGFLKSHDADEIDRRVGRLNEVVTPRVDCRTCGNCCKSLMVSVEEEEADRLSGHLAISRDAFDDKYLEKGSNGMMLMNTMPCHFLAGNVCTVYEHRFSACREFPALHLPGFNKRLFTTFMHYDRCPIIFNVVEGLKAELGFICE